MTSESLNKKRKRKRNRLTAYKESIVLLVMRVIFFVLHFKYYECDDGIFSTPKRY